MPKDKATKGQDRILRNLAKNYREARPTFQRMWQNYLSLLSDEALQREFFAHLPRNFLSRVLGPHVALIAGKRPDELSKENREIIRQRLARQGIAAPLETVLEFARELQDIKGVDYSVREGKTIYDFDDDERDELADDDNDDGDDIDDFELNSRLRLGSSQGK